MKPLFRRRSSHERGVAVDKIFFVGLKQTVESIVLRMRKQCAQSNGFVFPRRPSESQHQVPDRKGRDERAAVDNLVLADKRANTVQQALIEAGVSSDRISTDSYGKERPSSTESNEVCCQENREHILYTRSDEAVKTGTWLCRNA